MIERPIVIDASATMTWCFADEATTKTDALRDRIGDVGAVVPEAWATEVEASIRAGERRRRTDEAGSARFARFIRAQRITIDRRPLEMFGDLLPFARQHGLSVYDASYVELAARRGLPLATLDDNMQRVALELGIELIDVS